MSSVWGVWHDRTFEIRLGRAAQFREGCEGAACDRVRRNCQDGGLIKVATMQRCICYDWKLPLRMEVLHSAVALAQSAATWK